MSPTKKSIQILPHLPHEARVVPGEYQAYRVVQGAYPNVIHEQSAVRPHSDPGLTRQLVVHPVVHEDEPPVDPAAPAAARGPDDGLDMQVGARPRLEVLGLDFRRVREMREDRGECRACVVHTVSGHHDRA